VNGDSHGGTDVKTRFLRVIKTPFPPVTYDISVTCPDRATPPSILPVKPSNMRGDERER